MKRNRLRQGLKVDKKLKDGFYYFIVQNHIDWVILTLTISMLPYIGSSCLIFLIFKSVIFLCAAALMISYLRLWNKIRRVDIKLEKTYLQNRKLIKDEFIVDAVSFMNSLTDFFTLITNDYPKKMDSYSNFEEYLMNDQEIKTEIEKTFNVDKNSVSTALGLVLGFIVIIEEVKTLPKLKKRNFNKLVMIIVLIFVFFAIYTIELSTL